MRSLSAEEERLIAALRATLASQPRNSISNARSREICRLVSAMTKPSHTALAHLEPLCTTADLVDWLGVSRQAINKAVQEARILAVRHSRGDWRYPTWQLTEEGRIVPGLNRVLGRLHNVLESVDAATWFIQPCQTLEGVTPATWLLRRRPLHTLVAAAEERARRG